MSEKWRVACQNKSVKLVHLVGFIIEKPFLSFFIFLLLFLPKYLEPNKSFTLKMDVLDCNVGDTLTVPN